ncbi:MAG: hypothetical protein NT001_04535 [Candidatus Woesearchaeota archaeon]|nr:hypothetical protein [Candidatus Woesearchaeota archaeon]
MAITGKTKTDPGKRILPGKKAIFFTLSAILIVSLFMLYYSTTGSLSIKDESEMQESRVATVNSFAQNFEEVYLPRALYATTHRSLYSITKYIIDNSGTTPVYINLTMNFPQVMVRGTLCDVSKTPLCDGDNETLSGMKSASSDNTITFWLAELTRVSKEEMNIHSNFNITKLTINQTKPWAVNVTAYIEYNISSPDVVDIIRKNVAVSTEISIEGFIDPLIAAETNGRISRKINRSVIDLDSEHGAQVIKKIFAGKTYIFQNKTAPSFLMRFEKNLNASDCCGIESLITEDILQVQGVQMPSIEAGYKSYTDFQFWMKNPPTLCYRGDKDAFGKLVLIPDSTLYNITGISRSDNELLPGDDGFYFKLDTIHMDLIYGANRGPSNEMNVQCSVS